jgi:transposase InsO family protein
MARWLSAQERDRPPTLSTSRCQTTRSVQQAGVEALEEALSRGARPEIFNTDQGSQFTSDDLTGTLQSHGITISMDGKSRFMDNIFVERLWRSLKYEEVYLKAYATVAEVKAGISAWHRRQQIPPGCLGELPVRDRLCALHRYAPRLRQDRCPERVKAGSK